MQRNVAIQELYVVKETLGQGQHAKVVEAIDKRTDRRVALKIFNEAAKDQMILEQAAREIEIWKSIKHANCVQMHEAHETRDRVVIEMELLTGVTLLDRMVEKGRFSESEAADAITQILQGIQHLHSQGICHRDLQPANIMYASKRPDAQLKIVDFGLGRRYNSGVDVMRTVCGTPAYVAPEVFAMSSNSDPSSSYGLACDVWSAGVLLYCMLSGQQPFDRRGGLVAMVHQISQGRYSLSGEPWRKVSHEAKELIKAMLTVDPLRRISVAGCLAHPWLLHPVVAAGSNGPSAASPSSRARKAAAAPAIDVSQKTKSAYDEEAQEMRGCSPISLRGALSKLRSLPIRTST